MKTILSIIALTILVNPLFAQWEQLNGPPGGKIRSILYDGDMVYACCRGGVLVSTDQGNTWELRNNGLSSCDTKSLIHLDDYIFLSTDENVFRSHDQSLSWEPAGSGE